MKNKGILIIILCVICFILGGCFVIIRNNSLFNSPNTMKKNISEINSKIVEEVLTEPQTEIETQTSYTINYSYKDESIQSHTDTFYQDDKNDEAIKLYMEFLNGKRYVENIHIDDFTIPTGEPSKRYNTSYAFFDCNKDGLLELNVSSACDYYVISYKNEGLYVWNCWTDTKETFKPLNDGNFLITAHTGCDTAYSYTIFDVNGNELSNIYFRRQELWHTQDNKEEHYYYEGIEVSKDMYDKLTEKYFNIGDNEVKWNVLYYNYYDGMNHYKEY